MQIPRLDKIVINMGLGETKDNPKSFDAALADLTVIAGQKPLATLAKKSVANFKVREGMKIGAKVTLRSERMYEFADKLMNIALPRVRDFRGVSTKAFDGRGNYALSLIHIFMNGRGFRTGSFPREKSRGGRFLFGMKKMEAKRGRRRNCCASVFTNASYSIKKTKRC